MVIMSHFVNLFLYLTDDAKTYRYLSQEAVIPGVDDARCFQDTISALVTLGFSERKITDIFRVLASILHLGNIDITGASEMDDSSIPVNVNFFCHCESFKCSKMLFPKEWQRAV